MRIFKISLLLLAIGLLAAWGSYQVAGLSSNAVQPAKQTIQFKTCWQNCSPVDLQPAISPQ